MTNDRQLAAAAPDADICAAILRPDISLAALIRAVATGYADRPALGERATAIRTTGGRTYLEMLPRFDTVSYGELWQRVASVAAALFDGVVSPGARVATLGFCSVGYTTLDMAVPLLGAVSVPLHAGAPVSQLQPMIGETQPSVIACSAEYLDDAVALALGGPPPVLVVIFDYRMEVDAHREAFDAARSRLARAGSSVVVETLEQLIGRGDRSPAPPEPACDDERLAAIVYTSGSSGSPKGAMQPESLTKSVWAISAGVLAERGFAIPALTLNYMPMSHTAGRAMLYSTLGAGGTAYFAAKSDLSTLLDDLAMVRPTQLNFVPRVWEMIHREFVREVDRREHGASEDDVLSDMRSRVLGGRYMSALTGSAPIAADLAAWVERLLDSHLMNALGATESGSVIVDGKLQRPPVTAYKLADVPELGYFSTDRPHPRGELLIKSRTLFRGYYQRPALTAEVFSEDGFYRTGDVVAEIAPDELRYVDRRNNVLKLSQGEFVTVSKLEAAYANCELVHQIFVYGSGERSYLLAVVVPTEHALCRYAPTDLKQQILRSLQEAAAAAELESYEIPRDIVIESAPFTVDNGLLNPIGKPSRPNLLRRYGEQLERLYAEHDEMDRSRMRALREQGASRPVIDTVCAAAASVVGTASHDPAPSAHFVELGGDSLSALTFANTLDAIFGIDVPVGVIISPTSDMQSIADYISAQNESGGFRPTFESVHGSAVTAINAHDLTLDKFIDTTTLDSAVQPAAPSDDVRCVLLTGATGYLGRYLALEWLQRMSTVDGTVICLVRARNDAAARARLDAVFDSGDPDLLTRYQTLAAEHLEVLAADKGEAELGLDPGTWRRLAGRVDLIVDSAALVNHMLPYRQLFGPNVVGTAELIRLALTTRQKSFTFVSTVGVGATIPFGEFTEDADVRHVGATRPLDDSYASGYASSKWAGEVLLREAHDRYGLPTAVFRCDMLMAETTYRGQLNVPDMVTRLILSIAVTGIAPESFYIRKPTGGRPKAHFDGLPVDFVAEAISTLPVSETGDTKKFRTYHVMNPHDDGIGLDEYVDWMEQAGCRIERISDYGQWLARFESALRNLPERQRQASLLPLLVSFRHPQPPVNGAFAPTDRFESAVAKAGIGSDGSIPHVDEVIIKKYLSDLETLGLLATDRA